MLVEVDVAGGRRGGWIILGLLEQLLKLPIQDLSFVFLGLHPLLEPRVPLSRFRLESLHRLLQIGHAARLGRWLVMEDHPKGDRGRGQW